MFYISIEFILLLLQQQFTTGVNPMIQEWMSSMSLRQLSGFLPTITVTEGEVAPYLVYKSDRPVAGAAGRGEPKSGSSVKSTPKAADKTAAKSEATSSDQSVDTTRLEYCSSAFYM